MNIIDFFFSIIKLRQLPYGHNSTQYMCNTRSFLGTAPAVTYLTDNILQKKIPFL